MTAPGRAALYSAPLIDLVERLGTPVVPGRGRGRSGKGLSAGHGRQGGGGPRA